MNKAYKYRIYPTAEQRKLFINTFGCCRKIWNLMLSDKIDFYESCGEMLYNTPAMYKDSYAFLKNVDSLALSNVQLDLQSAYKRFFSDKSVGFPKYKSAKKSKKSYTTNKVKNNIFIKDNKYIKLPKAGLVRAKIHRTPKSDWKLKSVTISMEPDGKFYASVLFEFERPISTHHIDKNNAIGLDYRSDGLFMDSNGNIGTEHKYFKESQKKLAKAQKALSRKKPGSNNYKKQKAKVAKIHQHIKNQRLDNLHKLSTEIANRFDIVCVESLDLKEISSLKHEIKIKDSVIKPKLGKATCDNGYNLFINMLEYKLNDRDKIFIKVDKYYPSTKTCSRCGRIHDMPFDERTYKCECGLIMDRDLNAAINILNEGLRLLKDAA